MLKVTHSSVSLILLPYAGAGSTLYRDWARLLPDWIRPIAVDLPGHGALFHEAPKRDWPSLIDSLIGQILEFLNRPFAIFGHSMGALAGYELAHTVRERFHLSPSWFCASGSAAPSRLPLVSDWIDRPDTDLIAELRRLGGTPAALLENSELLDLLLPRLRADLHLYGSYVRSIRPPLNTPLLVLRGVSDDAVGSVADSAAWEQETCGYFEMQTIDDGHFFLDTQRDVVVRTVVAGLGRHVAGARGMVA